jgi:hypothetical protein
MGWVAFESMTFTWDMSISMLDWDPSDMEEPSAEESGGVSAPELDVVIVLERDREFGLGREKTAAGRTRKTVRQAACKAQGKHLQHTDKSSPAATRALSSRLWRTKRP